MSEQLEEIRPLQRRPSVGADITAQLQRLIQDGTYPPGSTLPSQRELARRFGASVPSVREALSVLVASGVLDSRTGHGTTVRTLTSAAPGFDGWLGLASSETELQDLLETRRLLEQFTVRAASQRVTPEYRRELYSILEDMQLALNDPARYVEADMRLHMTIADMAGNRVVSRLMRIIQAPLLRQLRGNVENLYRNGQLHQSLEDHRIMLDALCQGDPRTAFASIDKMLDRADRFSKLAAGNVS
ncbi:FadR/GntR family transcriptional regulator [Deinococcus peraridilitoris]|uniref:Transcriptional regulator n=1 Tax=Deinococcus peraridilitoris (strain DSM 19664 / LMG 22246 / CIP 109416 / KR-200) TaxID=937777 RepID=L0A693_DEIPD|nr:FadR/GntR family transcriptional regulator [Deinococcus peraridilitoris]AFZ68677.1 transcriptional regulator [Deinococcus peraridilitoris DSM 19664]